AVSRTAARIDPVTLPPPPRTTIATISIERMNRNDSGSRSPYHMADNPPATPAKKAPITNAATLKNVVSTPIAAAAISSSRIAKNALPSAECASLHTHTTHTTAQAKTQKE